MNIINLTPHDVTETTSGITYPASGIIARLDHKDKLISSVNGTPVYQKLYGEVRNLPEPTPNTLYLVSGIMIDVARQQGRTDLLAPGRLMKDSKGNVLGCKGFTR
jgi:hypothetical protein